MALSLLRWQSTPQCPTPHTRLAPSMWPLPRSPTTPLHLWLLRWSLQSLHTPPRLCMLLPPTCPSNTSGNQLSHQRIIYLGEETAEWFQNLFMCSLNLFPLFVSISFDLIWCDSWVERHNQWVLKTSTDMNTLWILFFLFAQIWSLSAKCEDLPTISLFFKSNVLFSEFKCK